MQVFGLEVLRSQAAHHLALVSAIELDRAREQGAAQPGQAGGVVVAGGGLVDAAHHGAAHGHGALAEAEGVVVEPIGRDRRRARCLHANKGQHHGRESNALAKR